MTTIEAQTRTDFHAVLASATRSPQIAESDDLYGWLIGSWELDILHYWTDVRGQNLKGEAHFGWVLDGLAVQDVWKLPRRAEGEELSKTKLTSGTTMRVWDPTLRAWRVTWINPASGVRNELIGRRIGNDIVQIGTHPDGTPIRWNFTEITSTSFLWSGEALDTDGTTWKLQGQFRARRIR